MRANDSILGLVRDAAPIGTCIFSSFQKSWQGEIEVNHLISPTEFSRCQQRGQQQAHGEEEKERSEEFQRVHLEKELGYTGYEMK